MTSMSFYGEGLSRIFRTSPSNFNTSSLSNVLVNCLGNDGVGMRTFLVVLDFIRLKLCPYPVDGLICHNGPQENLHDWTSEAPIEAHLFRSAIDLR